jgi:uncharacterized repeat protein (TIGR01451 family)
MFLKYAVAVCTLVFGIAYAVDADPGCVTCSEVSCGLVKLVNRGPECATKGQEFHSKICVQALINVGDVRVTARVPEGLEFVKSDPPAREFGRGGRGGRGGPARQERKMWMLGDMDACETKTIDVTWKMLQEGLVTQCVTIVAYPRACFAVCGINPNLEITKTGPEKAVVGDLLTYTITVKNTGSGTAEDVKLTDIIPKGLSHASGSSTLEADLGDMCPGAKHVCHVQLRADARGKPCNKAVVESSNAGKKEAEACTLVQVYDLAIAKTGPKEQYIGKKATYTITVSNPGDVTWSTLQLTDPAPSGTTIVEAEGGTVSGNTATWTIKDLKPGAKTTRKVTLTTMVPGTHENCAVVSSPCGTKEACAETLWKGVPAVLLEVIDTEDPLQDEEVTTYVIRVTNQGTEKDENVHIRAEFPKEVVPTAASGDCAGTVEGSKVDFTPYPVLQPKQSITLKIQAKGKEPGDGRIKVYLNTALIKKPVVEEESTHVY